VFLKRSEGGSTAQASENFRAKRVWKERRGQAWGRRREEEENEIAPAIFARDKTFAHVMARVWARRKQVQTLRLCTTYFTKAKYTHRKNL